MKMKQKMEQNCNRIGIGENTMGMQPDNNIDNFVQDDPFIEIMSYIKERRSRILWYGGISLVFTGLLTLVVCCLIPRTATYRLRHTITLPKKGDVRVYPSGKTFAREDLLSPSVLERVYTQMGLQNSMKYSDFRASLFLVGDEKNDARINAEFAEKLAMKNLSLGEIQQLESAYHTALDGSNDAELTVCMNPHRTVWIPEQKVTRILYAISENWFDINSKLEAGPFPQIESEQYVKQIREDIMKGSYLIPLEKARNLTVKMFELCSHLEAMLYGRNISLPSGEYLSDIKNQIRILYQYRLSIYLFYVIMRPELQSPYDRVFVHSSLERIQNDLIKYNAEKDGLWRLYRATVQKNSSGTPTAQKGAEASISLHMDGTFLKSVADLLRKDVDTKLREEYASRIAINSRICAHLEVEKDFYQKLLGEIGSEPRVRAVAKKMTADKQLSLTIAGVLDEVLLLHGKLIRFRDVLMNQYVSGDQFYTVDRAVTVAKVPVISLKTVSLVLFALWFLGNLIAAVIDFMTLKNQKKILP